MKKDPSGWPDDSDDSYNLDNLGNLGQSDQPDEPGQSDATGEDNPIVQAETVGSVAGIGDNAAPITVAAVIAVAAIVVVAIAFALSRRCRR